MKKRTMIFVTAMVLLFAMVTGSTLAYMTSKSGTVTNTFTYGNIKITLDELDVDEDDNANDNKEYTVGGVTTIRDTANQYKLIAGSTYVKDPTVHIQPNSESCYIFVNVQNNLLKAGLGGETIETQMSAKGWTKANATISDDACTVWYKASAFATSESVQDAVLFETVDIAATVGGSESTSSSSIVIEAYAVQSANMKDGNGNLSAIAAYNKAPLTGASLDWPDSIS